MTYAYKSNACKTLSGTQVHGFNMILNTDLPITNYKLFFTTVNSITDNIQYDIRNTNYKF